MNRRMSLFVFVVFVSGVASANAQQPNHPALRWGMPDTGHIIARDGYVLSYDGRLRSARWVAERLTAGAGVKPVGRAGKQACQPAENRGSSLSTLGSD